MGFEGFKQLYANRKEFTIVLLLRDSEKNREMFAPYLNDSSVKIVWGDLCEYDAVLQCVTGSDIVLHVGGLVSPAADYFPLKTQQVNVTAMQNIVDAVKAQPDPDSIRLSISAPSQRPATAIRPFTGAEPATR